MTADVELSLDRQVERAVRLRCGGQVSELRVEVHERGLTLWGRASSWYAKQIAQHTAAAVAGLPVRANAIVVS
jgi:hypothetical protein